MQPSDLHQPLAPGRKWNTVNHAAHGMGFALRDKDGRVLCYLWRLNNNNSVLWTVWIYDRPEWMTGGRTIIDLGPHDEPPFRIAEAIADATR